MVDMQIHYIPSMQAQYEAGVRHCVENGLKPQKAGLGEALAAVLMPHCGQPPAYFTGPMVQQFLECPACGLSFGTWGMNPEFAVQHWNSSLDEMSRLADLIARHPELDTAILQARLDKLSASRRQEYQRE